MSIGIRIKQAREANNYSLQKLADIIGISASTLSRYEREQDFPSSNILLRLSQVLKINVSFFFRPSTLSIKPMAYRKHYAFSVKEMKAILIYLQDWIERYFEVENLFPEEQLSANLPHLPINSLDEIEDAAVKLRKHWDLGYGPIENLVQVLEDNGIKIGTILCSNHFDACTFIVDGFTVIGINSNSSGDRQRFSIGHELGHLVLDIHENLNIEKAANRFAGAFLTPAKTVYYELGMNRKELSINELYMLKQKYGLSMQGWIYRANDLSIISDDTAKRLFQLFRANNWHIKEPGEPYPPETPIRMERLIYRALAEDLISISKAQELLGKPLQPLCWEMETLQLDDFALNTSN